MVLVTVIAESPSGGGTFCGRKLTSFAWLGHRPRSTRRKAENEAKYRTDKLHIMSISTLPENIHNMDIGDGVEKTPFPAPAKQIAGLVNGVHTDVSSFYFADKILITISQGGRLSQWVCAPHLCCLICLVD